MAIYDYGPGRTYSTPQAAVDALFASVGSNPFTEAHYIRGWSGTYTPEANHIIIALPALSPRPAKPLVIDVEDGEEVIFDQDNDTDGISIVLNDGTTAAGVHNVTIDDGIIFRNGLAFAGSVNAAGTGAPDRAENIWLKNLVFEGTSTLTVQGVKNITIYNSLWKSGGQIKTPIPTVVSAYPSGVIEFVNNVIGVVSPGVSPRISPSSDCVLLSFINNTLYSRYGLKVENWQYPRLVSYNNFFGIYDSGDDQYELNYAFDFADAHSRDLAVIYSDYNAYGELVGTGSGFFKFSNGNYAKLSELEDVYGCDTHSFVETAPGFTDGPNGDFRLQSDSPLRRKGRSRLPMGYAGTERIIPDIGAYQAAGRVTVQTWPGHYIG